MDGEKRKKTDLKRNGRRQGVRVSDELHYGILSFHLIVVRLPQHCNKKKKKTKMGIFFKEAALRTCPINLDTASGVERTHWVVFLWVWKTCQNATRKIPRKSSGCTGSFPIVVEHTQWTALLVHKADSVLNQSLLFKICKKKANHVQYLQSGVILEHISNYAGGRGIFELSTTLNCLWPGVSLAINGQSLQVRNAHCTCYDCRKNLYFSQPLAPGEFSVAKGMKAVKEYLQK